MGKQLGTLRSYTRSPNGDVVEIFSDGRPTLVERPHRGFFIAHMIGARGEPLGQFALIPWASAWEGEIAQQKAISSYLKARPDRPVVTPAVEEPSYSIPQLDERTEQRHRGRSVELRRRHAHSAASAVNRSLRSSEATEERQGRIEDIMSALRSTGTFSSESELRARAEAVIGSL